MKHCRVRWGGKETTRRLTIIVDSGLNWMSSASSPSLSAPIFSSLCMGSGNTASVWPPRDTPPIPSPFPGETPAGTTSVRFRFRIWSIILRLGRWKDWAGRPRRALLSLYREISELSSQPSGRSPSTAGEREHIALRQCRVIRNKAKPTHTSKAEKSEN